MSTCAHQYLCTAVQDASGYFAATAVDVSTMLYMVVSGTKAEAAKDGHVQENEDGESSTGVGVWQLLPVTSHRAIEVVGR